MATVSIAVIGAGYWGRKVIREILAFSRKTGRVSLRSIVDSSPAALERCRQMVGPLDYRTDYQSLLSDPELSAVHVCSPNPTHFEIASAFIKGGKNVLVEKPLTLSAREAYLLVEQARAQRVVLSTGHFHRFNNGLRALKSTLEPTILGEPYYLGLEWTGILPPQDQGNVITDLAPHPFDIANCLTGLWPTKISCMARGYRNSEYRNSENEEVAFITCEYERGLVVDIEVSLLDLRQRRSLRIVAKKGTAQLDCLDQKVVLQHEHGVVNMPIIPSNILREEIEHFVNCVGRNRLSQTFSNENDGLLGAHVITCLEATRESLLEERSVKIKFPSQYKESVVMN
jgi:UDP-N-acetylglucosamine 3-dehydrogenase